MALKGIDSEIGHLHGISARLAGHAEEHPPLSTGLLGVALSVRNAATLLGVLLATQHEDEDRSDEDPLKVQ